MIITSLIILIILTVILHCFHNRQHTHPYHVDLWLCFVLTLRFCVLWTKLCSYYCWFHLRNSSARFFHGSDQEMATVLCMNGGTGERSYAKNSTFQKKAISKVKPLLEENIKRLLCCANFESNLKVADLGCSSGQNTLTVMFDIITIINNTKSSLNQEAPMVVLQIYLNDLFQNDFNNIFKLLPNFYERIRDTGDKVGACFVNATPGNFYGRLFPNNYIHFFYSSCSLHWLSQAPKKLTKEAMEPLNKGNIFITTTSLPTIYEAYLEQFQRDFKLFLKSRSDELKPEGSMLLTFIGREKDQEISYPWIMIGMVLKDMVLEGLVAEAKLDCFNLPIYSPTIEEVRQIIETEGSLTLQTLKSFKMGWDANLQEDVCDFVLDSKMRGEFITNYIRAGFEPLLTVEFGKDIMDELFSRFEKKLSQLKELDTLQYTFLVMSMRKDS